MIKMTSTAKTPFRVKGTFRVCAGPYPARCWRMCAWRNSDWTGLLGWLVMWLYTIQRWNHKYLAPSVSVIRTNRFVFRYFRWEFPQIFTWDVSSQYEGSGNHCLRPPGAKFGHFRFKTASQSAPSPARPRGRKHTTFTQHSETSRLYENRVLALC